MKKIIGIMCLVFVLASCGENKVINNDIIGNKSDVKAEEKNEENKIVEIKEEEVENKTEKSLIIKNQSEKEVVKNEVKEDNKIENYLGIEYLLLENGKLYCIFGDENDPNPNVGYLYKKEEIENIGKPELLEQIDYIYYKDTTSVYYHENICTRGIPGECSCSFIKEDYDINTFEKLEYFYYKDKNGIYNSGFELEGVDIDSFKVEDGEYYDAKDKNNFYLEGEIIEN